MIRSLINAVLFNKQAKVLAFNLLRSKAWDNRFCQSIYNKSIRRKMQEYDLRPQSINIENTNICPAECEFCVHSKMQRKKGIMEMELFYKIVDDLVAWGIDSLSINGFGESLCDPEFFEKVSYSKAKGIKCVSTNINSAYVTEEASRKLCASGLDLIYVSCNIEGEANAKRLSSMNSGKSRPQIFLSGIINEFEPKKYKGADGVSISYAHNWTGDAPINMPACRRDPCKLIWQSMYITWDGKVRLCCVDYDAKCIIGDTKENSLKEIWVGERIRRYKELHKQSNFSAIPICKNCNYNYCCKSPWL
jgi:radical SAM protein with 4Fe4S-binding SPASM domain